MSYVEILFVAAGLAMDCFAVSFSAGATQPQLRFKNALLLAVFFGFFQAMMPVIGWIGGEIVVDKISYIDHWIAFIILVFIGGRMIYESFSKKEEKKKPDLMKLSTLFILSIATSIDALAAGFSFAMINVHSIWLIVLIIGICSFVFTILGVYGGKKLCHIIKPSYAELLGGVILIAIGTKILIEHLLT